MENLPQRTNLPLLLSDAEGINKRSFRPDYIVIDDLDDDELCLSEERVKKTTDWVKEASSPISSTTSGFISSKFVFSKIFVFASRDLSSPIILSNVVIYFA